MRNTKDGGFRKTAESFNRPGTAEIDEKDLNSFSAENMKALLRYFPIRNKIHLEV